MTKTWEESIQIRIKKWELEFTEYTSSYYKFQSNIAPIKVQKIFADGATLILDSKHRFSEELRSLSTQLYREFADNLHINCYCTRKDFSGFDAHYDNHDVIVIQIEGNKKWFIQTGGAQSQVIGN